MKKVVAAAVLVATWAGMTVDAYLIPLQEAIAANSTIVVAPGPPPGPRQEFVPKHPRSGWVWISGHWTWRERWVWLRGHWVQVPRGYVTWVPGYWSKSSSGWIWVAGHWR